MSKEVSPDDSKQKNRLFIEVQYAFGKSIRERYKSQPVTTT